MGTGTRMDYLKAWLDNICISLPAVTIATMGGAISYLSSRSEDQRFSWYWFLVGTAGAGFVGVLMHSLLDCWQVSQGVKAAVVGISGYASNDVLLLLKNRLIKCLRRGVFK